ncbi:Os12g0501500 [Oryza sativa Japonica Group]|uniref:Os12g0501500 protein n=1 Tax=Oryza sativa subsp. japonica TaxID=39947 RepID=A0A0P0YAI9_ORYSJ|nr:Os12g0501500 [Oryza sativa Japonica Group]
MAPFSFSVLTSDGYDDALSFPSHLARRLMMSDPCGKRDVETEDTSDLVAVVLLPTRSDGYSWGIDSGGAKMQDRWIRRRLSELQRQPCKCGGMEVPA